VLLSVAWGESALIWPRSRHREVDRKRDASEREAKTDRTLSKIDLLKLPLAAVLRASLSASLE